jgi:2-hydroxychromene-2-carboxylate isomerase
MAELPTIYFDFGSPYAYLAIERAQTVLGSPVDLEPILLGAIFKLRGRGSWAQTTTRTARIAEIEARARRYGLPAVVWPGGWPTSSLAADRAAVWAKRQGAIESFTRALYRRQFAHGADITDLGVLGATARDAALGPGDLLDAIQRPEIKDALRHATDAAWAAGVRGVPTIRIGEALFYGDDKLEEAAAAGSGAPM